MEQLEDWKASIENRLKYLEYKLRELESKRISSVKMKSIENTISKLFSDVDYLKLLAYEVIDNDIRLVIVHNNNDKVEALREIINIVSKLEEKYPYIYFEPWIYHIHEFNMSRELKAIIKR